MALNPKIRQDTNGVWWLEWTPDAQAVIYDIVLGTGKHVQAGRLATSSKLGGTKPTVMPAIASCHAGVYEIAVDPTTPPPPPPPPPEPGMVPRWGVSAGWKMSTFSSSVKDMLYDKMVSLGAQYRRFDVHSVAGSQADSEWPYLQARGMHALPILYGDSNQAQAAAMSPSLAYDFAVKWKGRIDWCEILNEPDWGKDWTASAYASFAKAKIADFKRGNPAGYCLAGAFWKTPSNSPAGTLDWVQALIDAKAGMDAISLHLYDDPLLRGGWNLWDAAYPWQGGYYNGHTVRERLDAAGLQQVAIISTEGGGPCSKYGNDGVAQIVAHNLQQVVAGKLASSAIYTIEDTEYPGGWGLLDTAYHERPACNTYRSVALA
jgi:hypothetical protein